jgi:enoyl-CoA hydratase/carnithine racemase
MTPTDLVLVDIDDSVAVLTLNRPDARNAVDDKLRAALGDAIDALSGDDAVRAVILTGAGPAFCAGGDVKAMARRLETPLGQVAFQGWRRQQRTFALTAALHGLGKVTIAAVNGAAAGLGMDLALACDFIVAGPAASFASSFVLRGLIPDGGSLHYLPRRVGLQRAKELLFSGRRVDAAEGLRIGLVDVLAGEGTALAAAREYALNFTDKPPASLALTKSIVDQTFELSLAQTAALGGQAQAICYTTHDHRSSVENFLQRRTKPQQQAPAQTRP